MDEMEFVEIKSIMKYSHYSHKDNWEQARLIAYIIAQVNSKNKLKLEDILKFPWDDYLSEPDKSVSNEEVKRLREKAKLYTSMLNGDNK